jgi:hypothetical protein
VTRQKPELRLGDSERYSRESTGERDETIAAAKHCRRHILDWISQRWPQSQTR